MTSTSSGSPNMPVESLRYEQALQQLEDIVTALETGEHSLDTALSLFERGQALALHCGNLLDQAELRVRQITGKELLEFTHQE